jgi:hypothetical protein
MPGFGLRHAHASASVWKQTLMSSTASCERICAWIASTVARRAARSDVGPIGADYDEIGRLFELARRHFYAGQQAEILQGCRSDGFAVTFQVGVDHAVTIEKDRRAYHLVAFRCSCGCETRQCQTTA